MPKKKQSGKAAARKRALPKSQNRLPQKAASAAEPWLRLGIFNDREIVKVLARQGIPVKHHAVTALRGSLGIPVCRRRSSEQIFEGQLRFIEAHLKNPPSSNFAEWQKAHGEFNAIRATLRETNPKSSARKFVWESNRERMARLVSEMLILSAMLPAGWREKTEKEWAADVREMMNAQK